MRKRRDGWGRGGWVGTNLVDDASMEFFGFSLLDVWVGGLWGLFSFASYFWEFWVGVD